MKYFYEWPIRDTTCMKNYDLASSILFNNILSVVHAYCKRSMTYIKSYFNLSSDQRNFTILTFDIVYSFLFLKCIKWHWSPIWSEYFYYLKFKKSYNKWKIKNHVNASKKYDFLQSTFPMFKSKLILLSLPFVEIYLYRLLNLKIFYK